MSVKRKTMKLGQKSFVSALLTLNSSIILSANYLKVNPNINKLCGVNAVTSRYQDLVNEKIAAVPQRQLVLQ